MKRYRKYKFSVTFSGNSVSTLLQRGFDVFPTDCLLAVFPAGAQVGGGHYEGLVAGDVPHGYECEYGGGNREYGGNAGDHSGVPEFDVVDYEICLVSDED